MRLVDQLLPPIKKIRLGNLKACLSCSLGVREYCALVYLIVGSGSARNSVVAILL